MAETFTLSAQSREPSGKGPVRALRQAGMIPAVIYGDKKEPLLIALESKAMIKLYQTGRILATLIDVDVDGKSTRVIARDIQLHPVKDTIIHADFLRVSRGTKIAVEVRVQFLNEETCPGLKRGGVLNVVRYAVELLCPADNIPEFIELDLEESDIGDSLHISDIALPEGIVPTITDRDFTVATIAAPTVMVEEEETAEGEEGEGEEGEGEEGEGTKEEADGAKEGGND